MEQDDSSYTLFYLEHRSRVTGHKSNVTRVWQTVHIIVAMKQMDYKIALALLYLKMAVGEQVWWYSSSWHLVWQYTLPEDSPLAPCAGRVLRASHEAVRPSVS